MPRRGPWFPSVLGRLNMSSSEAGNSITEERDLKALARGDRNFVTALARGFELLRAFRSGEKYLGNGELSERTGIPRPTVSRLTHTLTRLGYLRYSPRLEKYQLGVGVLALGYRYLASVGVRELARPLMQDLATATDCMVAMGAADRLDMTYVEVAQGAGPMVIRLEVGSRLPIATSAIGRAYLAGLTEGARAQYLEEIRAAYPQDWPVLEEGINRSLEHYRKTGFCVSEGEWDREISGVGVPLILEGGGQVVAFNCGGSSLRLTGRVLEENLGPRLVDLVGKIERQLEGEALSA